ncbi:type IIA topoisomerase (DNA gyrase/topo II, topoisomerase IV), A subunit [Belliella baltica DSM 15883]|uniref:Type IIA topoisomerase (DNA gyrase/topo II, topoisomerase IV), A subunit n=1 Tax=Belliella baltica (strain DSM 15883 / CIP 108006 / LMG 21964 / BA134) TaxID=866536 RepID=I3Z882_BELBD|nr:DNA gyrase/topoisomerase IV subunit A [Belliella baltica]AFL85450.1 type IIA topoisomerase (DNA gyrase/topo II, topoisomerase IV), A subunit [Belliella baltica DSM 15883]
MSDQNNDNLEDKEGSLNESIPVTGMYKEWFLDYASYVILERAVPAIEDGLKPVQRRILHAMKEMDDGRFNKVANVIGQSMQYHPHGDQSIGDAIVNLGQKELLIETQGNWGDIRTGDGAAASRYIEARLSKFALEVVFNPQTTDWQLSYDGRKKEPVTLPVKFPLLLAQGVEGIAVGLSTKILPHNFIELIQGSIQILQGERPNLFPDFPTGGLADFSEYNEGQRGGRVKVRARIEEGDNKTLLIKDIPFGTTTNSLIESIIKANDKGKIKIKKVVDNTAKDVEIQIQLAPGQSPDMTIDALYAFTDCEVSISPNACVIIQDKPVFLSVNDILQYNTKQTKELLKKELEIRKAELMEKLLFSSLEKIFIENRIYRDIEECETWDAVIQTIDKGLEPFKPSFYREITTEDIVRLTEIKIKRISKFDAFKADELMRKLEEELKEVNYNLKHLTAYAIKYYENLLTKYGKGRERKTEIRTFDQIEATVVAANNAKLYVNRADGFVGYGLKKDEFVCDCSDLDDIIVFRRDGKCIVSRIQEKGFVGKDILHVAVFRKGDERMVYNLIYLDGESGRAMVKRFQVLAVTRDREYELTKGTKGSKVLYLTANANGEAEIVTIYLTQGAKARVKVFDFDFSTIEIKGRGAGGNILTKYPIRKIQLKMEGVSTLGGLDIYFDRSVGRLNTDQRGVLIGNFLGEDRILVFYKNGDYELTTFELTNRYEAQDVLLIEKFDAQKVISAIYYDGISKTYFVKRFLIETSTINKKFNFISDHKQSYLKLVSTEKQPQVKAKIQKGKEQEENEYDLDMLIDVKGWKSVGNKFSSHQVLEIELIQPKKVEKTEEEEGDSETNGNDDDSLEIGSTIDLKISKDDEDQLGLF